MDYLRLLGMIECYVKKQVCGRAQGPLHVLG